MNFTKIYCVSERCKDNKTIMDGAGAQLGGRVTIVKVCCPVCNLTLMIIPMESQYEYGIRATTAEERTNERIEQAKKDSTLKLAEEITRIKNLQNP